MLRRWVTLLTRGKVKYPDVTPGVGNWTLASGDEEYQRFRESAFRHFMQWYYGERDEDHAAAVFFNVNGAEYVYDKLPKKTPKLSDDEINRILARPVLNKLPGTDLRDLPPLIDKRHKPFVTTPPPLSATDYGYPPGTILCDGPAARTERPKDWVPSDIWP